ncbi:hypothetical protein B0J17DRAFT_351791 [Rhizoctonia solani]|nr:hypothetical protein B0J17DRAFT_351791 [Rhizoctonia solani]
MSGKIFAPKRRQSKLPLTTGDFTDPAKITRTGSHGGADSFKSTTAPTIMVLSSISDDVGNQSAPVQSPSMSSPQSPPPGFQIHQHDIRPRQPRLDVGHDLAPISLEQPEQNAIPYSPQNQQLNTRGSGFKMLEKAIRALHLGSKAIPQVQSAVEGFISCLDNFEASCRNREECEELVSELSAMADYLSRHLEDPRSQGLTKRILGIAEY